MVTHSQQEATLKDCWNLVLHLIQMSLQLTQTEINNLTGTIRGCPKNPKRPLSFLSMC